MGAQSSDSGRPASGLRYWSVLGGAAVGALVVVASLAAVGTWRSPSPGAVLIDNIWMNYTYTTPTPANDSQPLNEIFQDDFSKSLGSAGSQTSIVMSPYDNSTTNCTLWSLTVLAPFALVSVIVTDLAVGGEVQQPLPVALPAAVHGTSHWANLLITIGLPGHAGSFSLNLDGTASCP